MSNKTEGHRDASDAKTTQKDANAPAKDVGALQVLIEILWLLIQITYCNLEAIYRIFVPPPERSVKGEIVLVTGAGHGIGKEIALQYAALGATVIAWDINVKNNQDTVKEIQERGYKNVYGYECDVAKREKVFEAVQKVKQDVGDITIIVNNAGIMPTHSLLDHTQAEIEKMFQINVFAHFWIIQAILPSMIKNNHGHIVSISSCAGLGGQENLAPYCGTKFAVRGYMEALSAELSRIPKNRIELTTICPYIVDTGLCKKPRIRFANSMKILTAQVVAEKTIEAQRRGYHEITIPADIWYSNNIIRTWSRKASLKIRDFLDVHLESDL